MGYESDVSQSVSKIDNGTTYTSAASSADSLPKEIISNDIFLYKLADHVKVKTLLYICISWLTMSR